ncbi:hypothetical protein Btru_067626 [Bulinus truncatus]|nr:hypothetical protein Btru_067626 [Bulinus truncatus]
MNQIHSTQVMRSAILLLSVHMTVHVTAKSMTWSYYNIGYIFNRGEAKIELNVSTSYHDGLRIVNFFCTSKYTFRQTRAIYLWLWPTYSYGLPSYVAGLDIPTKRKSPIAWIMAANIRVTGDPNHLWVNVSEPFYRQFGSYKCQARGTTAHNASVEITSTPVPMTKEWFLSHFPS